MGGERTHALTTRETDGEHAHTHTHGAAFSLVSRDIFGLPVKAMTERQTEQQDTPDTLMLLCMLEAYSNRAEL